jgi:UDP-2,4-diacetamido-2,4,6-trideoxy-beta-L-altropyranose hydrolase
MRKKVLFRADSSSQIGLGHVKRDLVFASGLTDVDIVFASQDLPGNINHQIPYPVYILPSNDSTELIDLCRHLNIDWLIIDHYAFIKADEEKLKQNCTLKLSVFDDSYKEHYCDEIINHNLGATAKKYAQKVPPFCKISLIPPLIRKEFIQEKRYIRNKQGVLLCLGGADPKNVSLQVLKNLKQHKLQVNVALTSSNPNLHSLQVYAHVNKWIKLHVNANIPRLMNSCELAIVTPSVTAAEALFMKMPIITIRTAENQIEVEKFLKKARVKTLALTQIHKLRNKSFLQKTDTAITNLYNAINTPYILHNASLDDLKDLYELANDPIVRSNSFSPHTISFEDHTKWLQSVLLDDNINLYTVRSEINTLIAQIRFNKIDKRAIISISISKHFRGKAIGAKIIQKGCQVFLKSNPNTLIEAQIKENNIASQKSFQKAGFKIFKKEDGKLYYLYEKEHE